MSATIDRPKVEPGDAVAPKRPPASEPPQPHPADEHELPKDLPKPSNWTVIAMTVVFCILLAALFVLGWVPHHRAAVEAQEDASAQTSDNPVVGVIHPHPTPSAKDLLLPCDVKANQATAIFPRANGYLKQWFFDVGAHVKKDQLLAIIDTPDVDAQLAESQATLAQSQASVLKSEADIKLAKVTLDRYVDADKISPGSVSQLTVDQNKDAYDDAVSALGVAKATVQQSAADVQRLTVLQGFEKIPAPFDGIITNRVYDVGALLNPTVTTPGTEMFDIAQTDILRVYVSVPQPNATNIQIGQPAYLRVRNYPEREFQGIVARMTGAITESTRTMQLQLDFPNATDELYPGMYGQARIPITISAPVLVIPTSALVFNADGLQAVVIRDGKAHFQKIVAGKDNGTEIEVASGLSVQDEVVVNPGERISEGTAVQISSMDKSTGLAQKTPDSHASTN
jgi:RND family efflux transporter MFP subunit